MINFYLLPKSLHSDYTYIVEEMRKIKADEKLFDNLVYNYNDSAYFDLLSELENKCATKYDYENWLDLIDNFFSKKSKIKPNLTLVEATEESQEVMYDLFITNEPDVEAGFLTRVIFDDYETKVENHWYVSKDRTKASFLTGLTKVNDSVFLVTCKINGSDLICPEDMIGSVIGKNGQHIKLLGKFLGRKLTAKGVDIV